MSDKPILTEKNILEREKFESYTGKSVLIRTFCVGSESGHPIYLTALRGKSVSVYAPYHQFKAYRDLSFQLADFGINSDFIDGLFPPSYGKSKLGIKLTEEELENVLMKKRELYPNMRLEFLIYTKYSLLVKDCLYIKYKETNILDWIHNVDLEELIESIEQLFEFLNLELEPQ